MADIQIINDRIQDFKKFLDADDINRVADVYATDAQLFVPNKHIYNGREGLLAYNEHLKQKGKPTIEYRTIEPVEQIADNWALVTLYFYMLLDGNRVGLYKAVNVWKKVGAQWYIYRSIFNEEPE